MRSQRSATTATKESRATYQGQITYTILRICITGDTLFLIVVRSQAARMLETKTTPFTFDNKYFTTFYSRRYYTSRTAYLVVSFLFCCSFPCTAFSLLFTFSDSHFIANFGGQAAYHVQVLDFKIDAGGCESGRSFDSLRLVLTLRHRSIKIQYGKEEPFDAGEGGGRST